MQFFENRDVCPHLFCPFSHCILCTGRALNIHRFANCRSENPWLGYPPLPPNHWKSFLHPSNLAEAHLWKHSKACICLPAASEGFRVKPEAQIGDFWFSAKTRSLLYMGPGGLQRPLLSCSWVWRVGPQENSRFEHPWFFISMKVPGMEHSQIIRAHHTHLI